MPENPIDLTTARLRRPGGWRLAVALINIDIAERTAAAAARGERFPCRAATDAELSRLLGPGAAEIIAEARALLALEAE